MNAPARIPSPTPSACDRVLAAVRWYYREFGRSPSFGDIEIRAGVQRGRIERYLGQLQTEGLLTWTPGTSRSIIPTRRFESASDAELIAECQARMMGVMFILPPENRTD